MQISATDLNRSPAKYVELAEAGETIDIVRRGEVVAKLTPAGASVPEAHNPATAEAPRREPVDPPVKKSAPYRGPVSEIEGLKPGERFETKEERFERMERMRTELGIKERPSPWETKHGKGK